MDNDTIVTLSELNIIDLLCDALGQEHAPHNVFVLRQASSAIPSYCSDSASTIRARQFLSKTGPPSEHLLGTDFNQVRVLPDVDPGEAILYACCANDPDSSVISGDLKSIRALAHSDLLDILDKLQSRVLCTEQCVLKITSHYEFEDIQTRWTGTACDHMFFSEIVSKSESEVQRLLKNRLNGLPPQCKKLLGWP